MMSRCRNPRSHNYDKYGGRGIIVCPQWTSFEAFLHDMGERPDGTSLERLDVNGDYEPSNCRWATQKEQCRNTRTNRYITACGVTRTLIEWAEVTGIKRGTIAYRLNNGWPTEQALNLEQFAA